MRRLSLRARIFTILCVLFLGAFSVFFFASRMPYDEYDHQLYEKTVQLMTLYAEKIEKELSTLEDLTLNIIGDNEMQADIATVLEKQVIDTEWANARTAIKRRVTNYLNANKYLYFISIATEREDFLSAIQVVNSRIENRDVYWNLALEMKGKPVWQPDRSQKNSLVLIREIREIDKRSMRTLGVIMAKVHLDDIVKKSMRLFEKMDIPLDTAIYMQGDRIYDGGGVASRMDSAKVGWNIEFVDDKKFFDVVWKSGLGWTYIIAMDYSRIAQSISGSTMLTLFVMMGSMLVVLCICLLLVNSVLKHFNLLLKKFDDYRLGWLPVPNQDALAKRRDEVGKLYSHFDQMILDHHTMTQEVYTKQLLLHDAQIKQLKQQIQPHFLFNTLETINLLSLRSRNEDVSTITSALGKMLRVTLKEQRNLILLKEDMMLVNNFLQIQQIRYGERLKVEIDIELSAECVLIPCMTIQPLVENSIIHALEEMIDTCVIQITARDEGEFIRVSVQDNGPGMAEDILEKIERKEIKANGLGIGLTNIDQRLKLLLSKDCGLKFKSDEDGTCVSFSLPRRGEDAQDSAGR